MKQKINLIKFIKIYTTGFLLVIVSVFLGIDTFETYKGFRNRTNDMRSTYIAQQEDIVKQEVLKVVQLIRYEKSQAETVTRTKIKKATYEACSIAQNIYEKNKHDKSKQDIQKMIIDALSPIRHEHDSYYFMCRLDGVAVLFPSDPEMEGVDLSDVQDSRGQYLTKDMINIIRQSGEGFYEYHWLKPNAEGNDYKKISYIKQIEPYDMYIGSGFYVGDIEDDIKSNLLSTISRMRFGKEGYIFAYKSDGTILVSNGKIFTGKKKLWEVYDKDPEKMKNIYKLGYEAAKNPEGDYFYYSWKKLSDATINSPKISFAYSISELQWLIGAGVYLDDVETEIAILHTKLSKKNRNKFIYYLFTVVVLLLFFIMLLNRFNRILENNFKLFISFFNRATSSNIEIDRQSIRFVEFDHMAENANKM
ncbi:MAG: cache domain-containing protein, partial [Candidatus Marinimicrobia bacterium]|nr:cache domain-containing protein [Candidatus Neomarinimicrobiota bacterium]